MNSHRICCVVPARNEAAVIEATLRSLMSAGMPAEHIYLVDDFSSDETGAIGESLGVNVLRNNPNLGKAHAIKRAVEVHKLSERYEFIALMDADTLVSAEYFSEMKKAFNDPEVSVVCGRPKSRPCNWLTAYRAFMYNFLHYIYRRAQNKLGVINIAPGCSTVYRATIWHELDWNKDTITEDMDVTIQVHKKKLGKIAYAEGAVVYTQDPQTLNDYGKQMYRWNTGMWQVIKKHKVYRMRSRIDFECALLFGEGLVFGVSYLMLPFLVMYDYRFVAGILIDMLSIVVISIFCAVTEKRTDVIRYAVTFQLLRFYDAWLFVKGFWKVIIMRGAVTEWFTPARYKQN